MSDGPVFIVGLADTGKTPLGRILTDRTSFVVTRRTQLWRRFDGRFGDLRHPQNLDALLAALTDDPTVQALQPDPDRLRGELETPTTYAQVFALLHAQHAQLLGKRRWGEQWGAGEVDAPDLLRNLPTASILHLVRHPVTSYRVAEARSRSRFRPGRLGRFVAGWAAAAERGRRNAARFPDRYLIVRYESLVGRTDATVRAVCDFLAEPLGPTPVALERGRPAGRATGPSAPCDKYAVGDVPESGALAGFVRAHAVAQLRDLGYIDAASPSKALRGAQRPVDRVALAAARRSVTRMWSSGQGE